MWDANTCNGPGYDTILNVFTDREEIKVRVVAFENKIWANYVIANE